MSCEEDIQISYYSAILAKALNDGDGDLFIELYDMICDKTTPEQVEAAKEEARKLSSEPLEFIRSEIERLKKDGAKPLVNDRIGGDSLRTKPIFNDEVDQDQTASKSSDKLDKTSLFSDINGTISPKKFTEHFLNENGRVNDETLVFDSLKDGERSLVDLQSRLNETTIDSTSKLEDNKRFFSKQLLPTARKTLNGLSGNKGISSPPVHPENNSQKKAKSAPSEQNNKPKSDNDISTCVNFNLFKPISEARTEKKQQTSTGRKNTDSKNDQQKSQSSSTNLANAVEGSRKIKKSKNSLSLTSSKQVKELPEKSEKISQLTFATNKHNVPKSNVSETKPVETFPKPPTKPKRRTIKDYQREKFNQTVSNVESQPVHHEVSHLSKARQRKQDEQRKLELLPDETVKQILIQCGDLPSSDSKKNKQDSHKKDKKKWKKMKKAAKKNEEETKEKISNEENQQNSPESHPVLERSATDIKSKTEAKPIKKKQKDSDKQPIRGKPRQNTTKTRNSSSEDHVNKTLSRKKKSIERVKSESASGKDLNSQRTVSVNEVNARNSTQWTTAVAPPSSLFEGDHSEKHSSRYPVRFQTTLDSTGCSLASSSEDGASTSSTSSNTNNSSIADLLSPNTISQHDSIASMLSTLVQAASKDLQNPKKLQPKNTNEEKNALSKASDPSSSPPMQQPPKLQHTLNPRITTKGGEKKLKNVTKRTEKLVSSNENEIEETVFSELSNEWGLDFFYTDNTARLHSPDTPTYCSIKSDNAQFSFEVGSSGLEITVGKMKEKPVQNNVVVKSLSRPSEDASGVPHFICGNFNFEEAANVLRREWHTALRRGKRYDPRE